jgi:hypothetical protein
MSALRHTLHRVSGGTPATQRSLLPLQRSHAGSARLALDLPRAARRWRGASEASVMRGVFAGRSSWARPSASSSREPDIFADEMMIDKWESAVGSEIAIPGKSNEPGSAYSASSSSQCQRLHQHRSVSDDLDLLMHSTGHWRQWIHRVMDIALSSRAGLFSPRHGSHSCQGRMDEANVRR